MPRFNKLILLALTFVALSFASASVVRADSVTIAASDSGWYLENGLHNAANKNYSSGTITNIHLHNYFTFNLTGLTGSITSATLQLFNPGGIGPGYQGPPGTYTLYDVLTPASIVSASNSGAVGVAIYNDLGSGITYGSVDVSSAVNGPPPHGEGTLVSITLNAAALAALNANHSGVFAIGGNFFSPTAAPGQNSYIFGGSGDPSDTRQLALTTDATAVPEPATWLLFGTGLMGIVLILKRRCQEE